MITPQHFSNMYTQDQVDLIANRLLVNLDDLSRYACGDGVMYGVETGCDDCREFEVNRCLRQKIMPILSAAQGMVESRVGYSVTPRTHVDDIVFMDGDRLHLKPGLKFIGQSQQFESVGTGTVDVFLSDSVEMTYAQDYSIAQFPVSLADNPELVTIWNADQLNTYQHFKTNGYPKRSGGNWQITVDRSPATGSDYLLSHCHMVKVDWVHNGAYNLDEIKPVYAGTSQIIPEAQPREVVDGNTIRFWFNRWVVMDPAFFNSGMSTNENYKLLETIEIGHFDPVAVAFTAFIRGDSTQTPYTYTVDVIDASMGAVLIRMDSSCPPGTVFESTLHYMTDPENVVGVGRADLVNAREAIIWHTFAELPTHACGCANEGIIALAQANYNDVVFNPFSGELITKPKYGELHGHHQAESNISQMHRIPRSFII